MSGGSGGFPKIGGGGFRKIGGGGFPKIGGGGGFPKIGGGGGGGSNQMDRGCAGGGSGEIDVGGGFGRADGMVCAGAKESNGHADIEAGGDGRAPSPIFVGMRILLVGFAPKCRRELETRITERGGSVLSSAAYELYTHICVEGETQNSDKRIITKEWIKLCCDCNMRLDMCNVLSEIDEAKRVAMSDRMRLLQGTHGNTSSKARRILYFDETDMLLHELFLCEADKSQKISLQVYLLKIKELVTSEVTPAAFDHMSVTTSSEVKGLVRELFVLIRSVHRAGFSLWGRFNLENFLVDESRVRISLKFTNLPKSILQKTQAEGETLDLEQFVRMVKKNIFKGEFCPHDMTLWLSMVGETDLEELMPHHALLMDVRMCSESFTDWYDIYLDLAQTKKDKICENLKTYNVWKHKINGMEGNELLAETLDNGSYADTVQELLRLLRNSRQHSSRYRHAQFALIVGQNFPNLISDFQKELYKAGCVKGILK